MKYAKMTIVGACLILFCSNFSAPPKVLEDTFVEIYFSNKLNLSDLAGIQSSLAAKEIKLNYTHLRFDTDGKLTEIEYRVAFHGVGGGDQTDNTKIEIGFIVNTSIKPKYGIIVGDKESIQKRRLIFENQH